MDAMNAGDLLRAFRSGDESAFAELVRRFETPLLRYARCLCSDAAEDIVQDVFLRLARTPPTLPPDTSEFTDRGSAALASWLHRVARNRAMELLRSDRRRTARELATAATEPTANEFDRVDASDTKIVVERALARLSDDQREVLILRLLSDRSYREIAEITGRKIGTVGWLIAVGMAALTRELSPKGAVKHGVNGVR
jgi:RNA polymerase sigma-70 factor, ECF subfamily